MSRSFVVVGWCVSLFFGASCTVFVAALFGLLDDWLLALLEHWCK